MVSQTASVTTGDALRALASPRRRQVVRILEESVGTMTFDHLVDAISIEAASDGRGQSTQVALGLRHTHLPMLEDAGIITRTESGPIRYRPIPLVAEVLEACEST